LKCSPAIPWHLLWWEVYSWRLGSWRAGRPCGAPGRSILWRRCATNRSRQSPQRNRTRTAPKLWTNPNSISLDAFRATHVSRTDRPGNTLRRFSVIPEDDETLARLWGLIPATGLEMVELCWLTSEAAPASGASRIHGPGGLPSKG